MTWNKKNIVTSNGFRTKISYGLYGSMLVELTDINHGHKTICGVFQLAFVLMNCL